ncbi:hypothetical protein [Pedobacter antarcticus]|uniref:hypothetical protein n=1 Tax=Pedobacter antarcticus TaxID=34086 RepID=UPI001C578986|nr:hypothetical protein [Pedobacter antarcticus]
MFNLKFSSKAKQFESSKSDGNIPAGFIPFCAKELSAIVGGCEESIPVNYENLNFLDLSEEE